MKEPIEYLGNVNAFTTREELYNIGKQMQIDAWNLAILAAIENSQLELRIYTDFTVKRKNLGFEITTERENEYYGVSESSILKLLKS